MALMEQISFSYKKLYIWKISICSEDCKTLILKTAVWQDKTADISWKKPVVTRMNDALGEPFLLLN